MTKYFTAPEMCSCKSTAIADYHSLNTQCCVLVFCVASLLKIGYKVPVQMGCSVNEFSLPQVLIRLLSQYNSVEFFIVSVFEKKTIIES